MKSKRFAVAAATAVLAAMALGVGLSQAADKVTLTALVVSSAKVPYDELAAMFEKSHPDVTIEAQYLGGGQIATALDNDTAADIVLIGSGPLAKVKEIGRAS